MKKCLLIIMSVVIAIAYFARVIYVNVNYGFDDTQVITYDMGETCEMDGFNYTVKDFNIYTMYEMEEKFNIDLNDDYDSDHLYNLVTIDVENIGDTKRRCPIVYGELMMISDTWYSFVGGAEINDASALEPKEKRTMYIYTTNFEAKIQSKNWEEVAREMKFSLIRIYYPKEVRLKCY